MIESHIFIQKKSHQRPIDTLNTLFPTQIEEARKNKKRKRTLRIDTLTQKRETSIKEDRILAQAQLKGIQLSLKVRARM